MEKYKANYIKGLYAKKPHQNAPKFVISNISMKRLDLIEYLQNSNDEYINAQIKDGQKGYYVELNTWKKSTEDKTEAQTVFNTMIDEVVEGTQYTDDDGEVKEIPF